MLRLRRRPRAGCTSRATTYLDRATRPGLSPPHADGLPGPLRLAQPAHDGRPASSPSHSRPWQDARRRLASKSRPCSRPSALPTWPTATRTSSRAASASASASRGRSRSSPSFHRRDEPVSALDVSIQAQVINLLQRSAASPRPLLSLHRPRPRGGAPALPSRRRDVSRPHGRDRRPRRALPVPLHPYTQALISAVPVPDPEIEMTRPRIVVTGEVPSALKPAFGLPLPPALPRGHGHLQDRAAAAARGDAGTRGVVSSARLAEAEACAAQAELSGPRAFTSRRLR